MQRYTLQLIPVILIGLAIGVTGCQVTDDPVSSEAEDRFTVTIQVNPPEVLRTVETKNLWTEPVEAVFKLNEDFSPGMHDHAPSMWESQNPKSLEHPTHGDYSPVFIGTRNRSGLYIGMHYGAGRAMYRSVRHGMMERHGPREGDHHYLVNIYGDSSLFHYQGAMLIPHSNVSLTALGEQDTVEIALQPVYGTHGYRYESNAMLPEGEYDIQVMIAPPDFYRTEETRSYWTEPVTVNFPGMKIDSTVALDTIGTETFNDNNGNEFRIALETGLAQDYWTMPSRMLPAEEGENINFSLRLSDPSIDIDELPIHHAGVFVMIRDEGTGEVVSDTLRATYGPHGFYYGGNLMMEILGEDYHYEDGHHHGHGRGGGMGSGGGHMGE